MMNLAIIAMCVKMGPTVSI